MDAEIGSAAGTIWRYLAEHGAMPLRKVKQGTKLHEQVLLLGLGWLAREGKIELIRRKRSLDVALKEGALR